METRGSCSEEFSVVVGPLIGEFLRANQRVNQLVALIRIRIGDERTDLVRRWQKADGIHVHPSQKLLISREWRMWNVVALDPSKDVFVDEILSGYRRR